MNAYLIDKTPRPNKPVNIAVNSNLFDNVIDGIAQPSAPYVHVSRIPPPAPPRRQCYHYDDIRRHAANLPGQIGAAEYRKRFAINANYNHIYYILKSTGKLKSRGQS